MSEFEKYCSNYNNRLEAFLKECPDANETDFIEAEKTNFQHKIESFEKYGILSDNSIKIDGLTHRGHYYTNKKIVFYLSEKEKNLRGKEIKGVKENETKILKTNNQTLEDIWVINKRGTKKELDLYLSYLKEENPNISGPFINEINGVFHWNKNPTRGWQQYLAGFIHICIKNKWILDNYSSPQYLEILNNTFNVKPSDKPFKSISSNPPQDKYLKPFLNLIKNE